MVTQSGFAIPLFGAKQRVRKLEQGLSQRRVQRTDVQRPGTRRFEKPDDALRQEQDGGNVGRADVRPHAGSRETDDCPPNSTGGVFRNAGTNSLQTGIQL